MTGKGRKRTTTYAVTAARNKKYGSLRYLRRPRGQPNVSRGAFADHGDPGEQGRPSVRPRTTDSPTDPSSRCTYHPRVTRLRPPPHADPARVGGLTPRRLQSLGRPRSIYILPPGRNSARPPRRICEQRLPSAFHPATTRKTPRTPVQTS